MSVVQVLKFIINHPLNRNNRLGSVKRFLKWQIGSRLLPYPITYPFIGNTKLIIKRGMTGATGNLYAGLHDFEDMGFLLHLLRPEDLFADIGANIGSYTLLASGHRGANAIAFEPIPATYEILKNNIAINQIERKVTALNIGLGSKLGSLKFTNGLDTMNHVAKEDDWETSVLEVKVDTLDNVMEGRVPLLMKVDVEGFETEVLNGAAATLKNPALKAIIIELNGSGKHYGYDDADIKRKLESLGFNAYQYEPFKRKLIKMDTQQHGNMLYLRDMDFINERIKTSPAIQVLGHTF
ncbi:FkbM family methyltransferase [Pseudoflavitalea sp. X16]|uniref:FkbM family methyltransferase n=1 Tax=Paraflavitalea devenefica TaxID=2716334 RepID=UPI001422F600|nr:FkbM family methyltransferase [Paraflavitalea devenefica]NII24081.1 FkbM family methyltransferase [Paraflavitalea devenefica]